MFCGPTIQEMPFLNFFDSCITCENPLFGFLGGHFWDPYFSILVDFFKILRPLCFLQLLIIYQNPFLDYWNWINKCLKYSVWLIHNISKWAKNWNIDFYSENELIHYFPLDVAILIPTLVYKSVFTFYLTQIIKKWDPFEKYTPQNLKNWDFHMFCSDLEIWLGWGYLIGSPTISEIHVLKFSDSCITCENPLFWVFGGIFSKESHFQIVWVR